MNASARYTPAAPHRRLHLSSSATVERERLLAEDVLAGARGPDVHGACSELGSGM